jgi:hypothetical protein
MVIILEDIRTSWRSSRDRFRIIRYLDGPDR